jgi:Response regulator containing CheY-like receiver, AAA-type ATPase, and DNA-binding domains
MVLVVEDEDAIRRYATALLTELGFTVVGAADGNQALATFHDQGDDLALVLLDLTLPGLSGEEILEEMAKLGTKTPVVVCSGSDAQAVRRLFGGQRVAGFLTKPYGLEQLRSTLRAALS